ncbi:MAG: DUF4430 domain-containing protein [Clostridiales Family XIII bacterium]|nr:DUF4430 domain-containing protein [Clostridiales Family XIII bacterium]
MKKHRNKIIAAAFILCVLAGAWVWGGNYANRSDAASPASVADSEIAAETASETISAGSPSSEEVMPGTPESGAAVQPNEEIAAETEKAAEQEGAREEIAQEKTAEQPDVPGTSSAEAPAMVIDPKTGQDKYLTDPVPEGKPIPVEPQNATVGERTFTCTLSVRCDTILDNMKLIDKEKHELVPADGVIFPATTVNFNDGESVFNILQREMKRAKIHMEFENTPIYNSAYIEGINNLYEFDVGELSGWMYKVNGWYPNYGCSRYQVKDGDLIEWNYTCDLGRDLGEYWLGRDYFETNEE